jgi:hypothetical protein
MIKRVLRIGLFLLIAFGVAYHALSASLQELMNIPELMDLDIQFISLCDLDGSTDGFLAIGSVDKHFRHELRIFRGKRAESKALFKFSGNVGKDFLTRMYCRDVDHDGHDEVISFWTSGARTNMLRIFKIVEGRVKLIFEDGDEDEPELLDLNSDGKLEIILGNQKVSRIFTWDGVKYVLSRKSEPSRRFLPESRR